MHENNCYIMVSNQNYLNKKSTIMLNKAPNKTGYRGKYFSYFYMKTYVVGTH